MTTSTSTSKVTMTANVHFDKLPELVAAPTLSGISYIVFGNIILSPITIFCSAPYERLVRACEAFNKIMENCYSDVEPDSK